MHPTATRIMGVNKTMQRVLIAVFVIVDVVLIVGARRHVSQTPPASEIPVASATPTPAQTQQTPGAEQTPATDPAAQTEYDFDATRAGAISLANDGALVFGVRGRCSSSAVPAPISTSADGGAEVSQTTTALVTVLAAKAFNSKDLRVVGQDAKCEVREARSTDGGQSWNEDDVSLWYTDPDDGTKVVSPDGASAPECDVISVSQVTEESARVGCADGTIKGTGNGGKTWTELGRLDNLRVATFTTPTAGYALARYNGCAANAFTSKDGGATWQPGGCITGEPAQAIAASANGLVAIVADGLYSSTTGETWMQP